MGRRKKEEVVAEEPKAELGQPKPEEAAEPAPKEEAADPKPAEPSDAPPPKPRRGPGRPRKAAKAPVPVPRALSDGFAMAPFMAADRVLAYMYKDEAGRPLVRAAFDQAAIEQCQEAFAEYLKASNWELTPGWALLASYGMAFGTIQLVPIEHEPKRRPPPKDVNQRPQPAPEPKPQPAPEPAPEPAPAADASPVGSQAIPVS